MAKRKRAVKRISKRANKKNFKRAAPQVASVKKKIWVVVNNLLLFLALSLVSTVVYRFISEGMLKDLFFVMAMIFGFVTVGFLIALLVLVIVRVFFKKR